MKKLSEAAQELYDKSMKVYKDFPSKRKYYISLLNEIINDNSEFFDEDHRSAPRKMLEDIKHIKD